MGEHETSENAADGAGDLNAIERDDHHAGEDERTGDVRYDRVHERSPEDYDGTCLRPLGLCDLGGCCDSCWYRPDHPRFQKD